MHRPLALATAALATTLAAAPACADYFLDARQRGELIARGQITGTDGALYNVWIVPGYVQPAQRAGEGWRAAGHDLGEYADPGLYRDIGHHSRGTWRFARKDMLGDFALRGTADSWRDALGAARGRVHKRVFGWWFAYPWAVLEATGASVIRLGVGLPTGVAVGAGSVSVLPVAEFGWPAVRAGYHGLVAGTVMPVAAASWNTVVAPPLALFGQQPAAERADGFWMQRLDPVTGDLELQAMQRALTAWRDRQLATAPARDVKEAQHRKEDELARRREAALRELAVEQLAARDAAQAGLLQLLRAAAAGDDAPAAAALAALAQRHGRQPLVNALAGSGLDAATAAVVLDALLGPEGVPAQMPLLLPEGAKTDPLQRSLELMNP